MLLSITIHQQLWTDPAYLVHGRGTITVLQVHVSVERAKVDNDLLVGLGTGQVKGSPGMERRQT